MKPHERLNLAAGAVFFLALLVCFFSGRAALILDVPAVGFMVASEVMRRRSV